MTPRQFVAAGVGLLVLLSFFSAAYTVREWEQVIITQFGHPVGDPVADAGLHFKLPWIQAVNRFDKRILIWDGKKNEITTADKRFIWVDTTARWRIVDPLLFLQAVRTQTGAQGQLDGVIDSATRDVISGKDLIEVVRLSDRVLPQEDETEGVATEERVNIEFGRNVLVDLILKKSKELAPKYGIELIDVRIKRINYVLKVREAVFRRMTSERQRIAERYRAEGRGLKAEKDGERSRQQKRILSEAYRNAQTIIAQADAKAAAIFAEAYNADPDFYTFWRTLAAYEKVIGDNHTLVISPDSDLYRFIGSDSGK